MKSLDIDEYLNPIVPHPRYERWPKWLSRWFGYRDSNVPVLNDILLNWWILVSSFAGMIVLQVTFKYADTFVDRDVPYIIPSWAATAILIFNVIESPLGQPRNVFIGTFWSSLIGVCLTKLFMTNSDNDQYLWVCGSLAVGIASVGMRLMKVTHPPAGAAALLPSVDAEVRQLGWYYLPVQLLSAVLILSVACLFNNFQRRYPVYWWTSQGLAKQKKDHEHEQQQEKSDNTYNDEPIEPRNVYDEIVITYGKISLPEGFELTFDEQEIIKNLQDRIVSNEGQELNRTSSQIQQHSKRHPSHAS